MTGPHPAVGILKGGIMGKRAFSTMTVALLAAQVLFMTGAWAADGKPTIIKPCLQCHKDEPGVLRGQLGSVSGKAETIKIQIGSATWVVPFDDDTELIGEKDFKNIDQGKEIAIHYVEESGKLYATKVYVKPPAVVPEEKLIKLEELSALVEKGPEAGNYTLVDARPGPRYHEGYIPGSIVIYDAQFDENIDKLPKDKNRLLIFYCGGPT